MGSIWPTMYFNPRKNRWEIRGKSNNLRVTIREDTGELRAETAFYSAGTATLAGVLNVGGAVALRSTVAITGAATLSGALNVIGAIAVPSQLVIGGGNSLAKVIFFTGSMPATNGSANGVVGTISNATGLAVGDSVFAVPGTILSLGDIAACWVPTANTLNAMVYGSVPAGGYNVVAFRKGT